MQFLSYTIHPFVSISLVGLLAFQMNGFVRLIYVAWVQVWALDTGMCPGIKSFTIQLLEWGDSVKKKKIQLKIRRFN